LFSICDPIRILLAPAKEMSNRTRADLIGLALNSTRGCRAADRLLPHRGVEVLTGTSVQEATNDGVRLTSGEFARTRTIVWCVGVRPDPPTEATGLPTQKSRIIVDPTLAVPGHPEVFACADCAAYQT
jgi:NADH dehydrogenase FAD-containing subunit